jgi:hypothetical protein
VGGGLVGLAGASGAGASGAGASGAGASGAARCPAPRARPPAPPPPAPLTPLTLSTRPRRRALPPVNNVGTNIRKPTVSFTPNELDFILSTNLRSAYHLCQLCHPLLKAAGGGASVVFNSSVAGGPLAMFSGTPYAMVGAGGGLPFLAPGAARRLRHRAVRPINPGWARPG